MTWYVSPPDKDDEEFNSFMVDFFESMTNIEDPGTPNGTVADLTEKFIALVNGMKAKGMIK